MGFDLEYTFWGLVDKFSETKILNKHLLLCLNGMPLKFCL